MDHQKLVSICTSFRKAMTRIIPYPALSAWFFFKIMNVSGAEAVVAALEHRDGHVVGGGAGEAGAPREGAEGVADGGGGRADHDAHPEARHGVLGEAAAWRRGRRGTEDVDRRAESRALRREAQGL